MYAVVRTGGKQYRVAPGDILEVEKLAGNVGDQVVLDDVLLVATGDAVKVGQPNVSGASVTAKITGQHRGEKILVFRYRPKKRIRVRRGHRQYLTRLEIQSVRGDDFNFSLEAELPEESTEEAPEAFSPADSEDTVEVLRADAASGSDSNPEAEMREG